MTYNNLSTNKNWYYKYLDSNEQKIGKLITNINEVIVKYSEKKGSEADANLIINNIWLGNQIAAHDLNFVTSKFIKNVINVSDDVPNKFDFLDYYSCSIKDSDTCYKNIINVLEKGAEIINYSVKNNNKILVHCKRGHHRSASIVAFYLMKYHNMSLIDAIYVIKNSRPTAFRRINCMMQSLINYEINR